MYDQNIFVSFMYESADDMQKRSSTMVPSFVRRFDDNDYDEIYHVKKSVLAMVKEKARKWRDTLSTRKGDNSTPAWGVSLEEEDDEEVENPQYHGAPSNLFAFSLHSLSTRLYRRKKQGGMLMNKNLFKWRFRRSSSSA